VGDVMGDDSLTEMSGHERKVSCVKQGKCFVM
jgi:hypothetical protein